jgi:hypothetical protein
MKCAVEMGLGVMIYIPSFIKIVSGIQKLTGGSHTHREYGYLIRKATSIFILLDKESRLHAKPVPKHLPHSIHFCLRSRNF